MEVWAVGGGSGSAGFWEQWGYFGVGLGGGKRRGGVKSN